MLEVRYHAYMNYINNIQPKGSTRFIHLLGLLTSTWNSKKETKEKRVHQIYVVHPKYGLRPREGLSLYYLQKSPILQYEPSPHACHTIQYPQKYPRADRQKDLHHSSHNNFHYNEWLPHLSYIVRDLKDITYHNQCGINDFTFI